MEISTEVSESRARQTRAAAERYRWSGSERDETWRRRERGEAFPDSPEMLAARTARLIQRNGLPVEAALEATRTEALDQPQMYERILGVAKDLQSWSFLPRGARAARTVARISVAENGREIPIGTGFLVSPRLLLTNHHVLPDAAAAASVIVEFDAQVTVDNTPEISRRFVLDPGEFFVADSALDFALVLVSPGSDGRQAGETFGWNRLSVQTGKLVIGEPVNIIGHPSGRLKEISIRENRLEARLDDFLQYQTDTEPGSSGSPVFNDQWEVTALHHSGVPRTDDQGRILRRDGQPWREGDGDDAVDWVSNEGVRISVILKHLAALPLGEAMRAFLTEMGPESGLAAVTVPVPAPPMDGRLVVEADARSTPQRAGLPAAPGAFGGSRHVVFLHGRGQEERIPEVLRRDWAAGLNGGLTRAGLDTIAPADVCFPYYAQRLLQAMRPMEALPRSPHTAVEAVAPAPGSTRRLYEELIVEAAGRAGMPGPGSREGLGDSVRRGLNWLADTTDLDRLLIAAIFADVAAYLDDQQVREAVLDCVLKDLPRAGRMVLVTHSLGTVVAMDLLTRLDPAVEVELLVTAGSPLGLDGVHRRLLAGGPHRPDRVSRWFNAWCPIDPVAIGCPLIDRWSDGPDEVAVANPVGKAHDIEEYLAHPEVAHPIGAALQAPAGRVA
ncbi:trypsin-like peptidase domain-containing protein [Nonomuraea sp. PA05]|uniref:trypsin-like serine peptidase n=1 Tax=Nonomuraea sp. PA05 TaxID=2604466 RepID=UPI0011D49563|nr:serine protease [Nonomuraea sp. PA05]TYB61358.1 trypsin-like peptidase domain-containing protein [Nonomuraea sp. PA05]